LLAQARPFKLGAFDQRKMEARNDILVYTSEHFKEGTELSGPIEPMLYVSSDAKDRTLRSKCWMFTLTGALTTSTNRFSASAIETATIIRWSGWSRGRCTRSRFSPLTPANYFDVGHQLRIEISSSNFPRFDRNLNTGGKNYDEEKGVLAHNSVHHSKQDPSQVTVTVVKHGAGASSRRSQ